MPRFITCWVCYSLIGTVFLGQACNEGLHPDHTAGPTETEDKEQGGPKSPLLSTKAVADCIFTGPTSGEVHQAAGFGVALNDAVHPTGTVRFTPSASNGAGGFNPRSMDLSSAARTGPSPYTPTGSEPRTIAIANNVELTGPPPDSFNSKAQTGTSKIQTSSSYFISPRSRTGTGTKSDPFGLSQLLNTTTDPITQGPALTILKPGDTLYFLSGTYNFNGSPAGGNNYNCQLLSPTVSGTSTAPITLSAYPGATVNIALTGTGAQPVFGTDSPSLNYIRFIGFSVNCGPGYPVSGDAGQPDTPEAFVIHGTGNEVGYCEII